MWTKAKHRNCESSEKAYTSHILGNLQHNLKYDISLSAVVNRITAFKEEILEASNNSVLAAKYSPIKGWIKSLNYRSISVNELDQDRYFELCEEFNLDCNSLEYRMIVHNLQQCMWQLIETIDTKIAINKQNDKPSITDVLIDKMLEILNYIQRAKTGPILLTEKFQVTKKLGYVKREYAKLNPAQQQEVASQYDSILTEVAIAHKNHLYGQMQSLSLLCKDPNVSDYTKRESINAYRTKLSKASSNYPQFEEYYQDQLELLASIRSATKV